MTDAELFVNPSSSLVKHAINFLGGDCWIGRIRSRFCLVMTEVQISAGRAVLSGSLTIPENAVALVLFAHGSGSGQHSPRNQFVARTLNLVGLGTLLFDLLTPEEEALDIY